MPKGVVWRQEDVLCVLGGLVAFDTGIRVTDEWEWGNAAKATEPPVKSVVIAPLMHGAAQWTVLNGLLKGNTTAHWLAVIGKSGVPCGPINNIEQALAHPQVAARNMLIEVPDGSGGTLKLAGNPLKMSAFEDPKTRRPAPDLDSDRDAILSFLGG